MMGKTYIWQAVKRRSAHLQGLLHDCSWDRDGRVFDGIDKSSLLHHLCRDKTTLLPISFPTQDKSEQQVWRRSMNPTSAAEGDKDISVAVSQANQG